MTDIFSGKVTMDIGASAGSKVTMTNLKRIRLKRGPAGHLKPQTVMNTVPPVGWHKGHKYIEGEIHLLSENEAAFRDQGVDYIPDAVVNPNIPYAVVTLIDDDAQTWTITFTGFCVDSVDEPYADDEDTIWVVHFKAYYLTRTGPV